MSNIRAKAGDGRRATWFLLTTAHIHVIWDGRTLDEVRGEMTDPVALGRRRTPQLEHYDSWSKYINYMKQPDNYVDTLFVYGLASLYQVSVRIVRDIYNEPQIYYVGDTALTDTITVCFLPSATHYYAS